MRGIMDCERVLVAAPDYLEARGEPTDPGELIAKKHDCLMLRYPGHARAFLDAEDASGRPNSRCAGPSIPTTATC